MSKESGTDAPMTALPAAPGRKGLVCGDCGLFFETSDRFIQHRWTHQPPTDLPSRSAQQLLNDQQAEIVRLKSINGELVKAGDALIRHVDRLNGYTRRDAPDAHREGGGHRLTDSQQYIAFRRAVRSAQET